MLQNGSVENTITPTFKSMLSLCCKALPWGLVAGPITLILLSAGMADVTWANFAATAVSWTFVIFLCGLLKWLDYEKEWHQATVFIAAWSLTYTPTKFIIEDAFFTDASWQPAFAWFSGGLAALTVFKYFYDGFSKQV